VIAIGSGSGAGLGADELHSAGFLPEGVRRAATKGSVAIRCIALACAFPEIFPPTQSEGVGGAIP